MHFIVQDNYTVANARSKLAIKNAQHLIASQKQSQAGVIARGIRALFPNLMGHKIL